MQCGKQTDYITIFVSFFINEMNLIQPRNFNNIRRLQKHLNYLTDDVIGGGVTQGVKRDAVGRDSLIDVEE